MTLHGEIKVNGQVIGAWSARRLSPTLAESSTICTYECGVDYLPREGGPSEEPVEQRFHLEHRYGEGAVALASKILTRAVS
jgi:hypothetical protein